MNRYITFLSILTLVGVLMAGCRGTGEIQDGATAYKLKKYQLASSLLQQDYAKAPEGPEKAMIAFQIAESYNAFNNTDQAQLWYLKAYQEGVQADAHFMFGKMQMANKNYDGAIETFKAILKEEPYRRVQLNDLIQACNRAKNWLAQEELTTVTPLTGINSAAADFGLVPMEKGKVAFVSSRANATGEDSDLWTGNKFQDIYTAEGSNISFSNVESFSPAINGPFHESAFTFNNSFTEIYFSQSGTKAEDKTDRSAIMRSQILPEGGWSQPEPVFLFEDSLNVGHPFLTPDGEMLLYSAVDPQGYGRSDIYYSTKSIDGWSPPINLGIQINTEGDEAFPWLDKEGNLYFASNGHPGMGGLDVFKAEKAGRNRWSNPKNLGYPVNSSQDDFNYVPLNISEEDAKYIELRGYISSSREGGQGLDDIYLVERKLPPPTYALNGIVKEIVYKTPGDPRSEKLGELPIANATIAFYRLQRGESVLLDTLTTDEEGQFSSDLSESTDYRVFVSKDPDYFSKSDGFTTKGKEGMPGEEVIVTTEIILEPILKDVDIVIPNIYYDLDKAEIRPDAAAVLDTTILVLLQENPNLRVQLGSHTDSRGSDKYNKDLSQRRAESAVEYLVQKGIAAGRLEAKGYGETQLVNECDDGVDCPEERHQENRRTTFKVLDQNFKAESPNPK